MGGIKLSGDTYQEGSRDVEKPARKLSKKELLHRLEAHLFERSKDVRQGQPGATIIVVETWGGIDIQHFPAESSGPFEVISVIFPQSWALRKPLLGNNRWCNMIRNYFIGLENGEQPDIRKICGQRDP